MLYNFHLQDNRNIMFSKHFSLWNIYLAVLRPLGLWLSFLTCHSVLSLHKVWTWELGSLSHGGKGSCEVIKLAESQFLSPPHLGSELNCTLPSPRVKRGNCPLQGPWLWDPFALPVGNFSHSDHPYIFAPESNSSSKNVREIHDSIYKQLR